MEKRYLILDSNNNWLFTCESKEEALKEYKKILKQAEADTDYCDMQVGGLIWLFEAKQIKSDKTY